MDTIDAIERHAGITDADLRQMVGPDPNRPGPDRARLVEYGVPVWAIVGHFVGLGGGETQVTGTGAVLDQVATDYRIPRAAVAAALLYYREHRKAVDLRLAVNAGDS